LTESSLFFFGEIKPMKALGINSAVIAIAYFVDQQYYHGYYLNSLSSMVRQMARSFGWY